MSAPVMELRAPAAEWSCGRLNLRQALRRALAVVERRHTLPVLEAVQLCAGPGGLSVQATDLEVWVDAPVAGDVAVHGAGRAVMDGRAALAAVEASRADEVSGYLMPDGSALHVAGVRVRAWHPDEYPTMPSEPERHEYTRLVFRPGAWQRVARAASQDETRHNVCGVRLEVGAGSGSAGVLVATDGHRMHVEPVETRLGPQGCHATLPAPKKLAKLIGKRDGELQVAYGDPWVWLWLDDADGARVAFRSIESGGEEFPNWRAVIPAGPYFGHASLDPDALAALARLARGHRNASVVLRTTDRGRVDASLYGDEPGDPIDVRDSGAASGEPIDVRVDLGYLRDALEHAGAEACVQTTDREGLGALIVGPRGGRYAVVMPMRK